MNVDYKIVLTVWKIKHYFIGKILNKVNRKKRANYFIISFLDLDLMITGL